MSKLLAVLVLCASLALAQTAITTARMDGTVTDSQGAVVAGADVTVVNLNTGANFKAATDDHGQWFLPAMPQGVYRVSATMTGFRTTVVQNVAMDAGVPITVNAKLEVGAVSETIEVAGTQELVQTETASVDRSMERRQMTELPTITRGGLDMLISMPGVQTAGVNRNSTIDGLPNGSMSVTVDGLNTQDQLLKSSNGYYTYIPIQQDSVEAVTVSSAAFGADATGEGAAQVKFVTRSGSNDFHGGAFWQNRNTFFDANAYFNTINRQPRNIIQLNQYGFHVGGPIDIPKVIHGKNKLFFFTNVEFRDMPQSAAFSRTVITPSAASGVYTWGTPTAVGGSVNVLALAKAAGFPSTPDPIISKTFSQILALTGNGVLQNNIPSGDYNGDTLQYAASGLDRRHLSMSRLDYNINSKNQISVTYSYNMYFTVPDVLNGVVPIYPGTGDVLGSSVATGQHSNRFMGTISLRSTLTPHLTNDFHGGLNGGTVVFYDGAQSPANYSEWRGYIPNFSSYGFDSLSGVTTATSPQRRNSPVKQFGDTVSWLKGSHMLSFGGDFSQINLWNQSVGSETLPTVYFGINSGDPVHNGATDLFTAQSMPGATQAQMDAAAGLYAVLTGRVYSISSQVVESEKTHQYAYNTPAVDRDQQRQYGLFVQDQWRVLPTLTVNLGIRFEQQMPFENLSGIYTASTIQAAYGISGVGNMFMPGVTTGGMPVVAGGTAAAPAIQAFQSINSVTPYATPKNWNPNIGLAWQMPGMSGPLGWLFGRTTGSSVLRAGFSIATVREGTEVFQSMYGSNPGVTYPASVDPVNYPQYFGQPGSVLFSQPTLPTYPVPTAPNYPMTTTPTTSINAFDPNLKVGYVETWNLGYQRQIGRNNMIEIRTVGNHGVHEWRQVDLNEVNLFESGFLTDFNNAYNNLLIARNGNILSTNSNNFSDQGLAGQKPIPILQTALGSLTNNSSYATYIRQNRAGSLANVIYANATYMGRLTAAGYPANLFIVNPSVPSGGSYLITDWGSSSYDSGVIEYRRTMATGLQIQANYVLSKSLADGATASGYVYSTPTTFRNLGLDKGPASFDIRNAFKFNFIYELPFGTGKRFLSGGSGAVKKIFEGWEVTGIERTQSGTPAQVTAARTGMNNNDTGVVLENMTTAQLQSMMSIRKTTGSNGYGQVWYLPQSLVTNSQAAFEANGLNWNNLNTSASYIAPQLAPDSFGYRVFVYGPWQNHFDASLMKTLRLAHEKANLQIRVNCIDCLNLTNFLLPSTVNPSSGSLGMTTSAYSDISNSQDPGSRVIEFVVRVNF
jgi:hypothetical protein